MGSDDGHLLVCQLPEVRLLTWLPRAARDHDRPAGLDHAERQGDGAGVTGCVEDHRGPELLERLDPVSLQRDHALSARSQSLGDPTIGPRHRTDGARPRRYRELHEELADYALP